MTKGVVRLGHWSLFIHWSFWFGHSSFAPGMRDLMNLRTFKAYTMAECLSLVKGEMGPTAMILHTRTYYQRYWLGIRKREMVEITAGRGEARRRPGHAPEGYTQQAQKKQIVNYAGALAQATAAVSGSIV